VPTHQPETDITFPPHTAANLHCDCLTCPTHSTNSRQPICREMLAKPQRYYPGGTAGFVTMQATQAAQYTTKSIWPSCLHSIHQTQPCSNTPRRANMKCPCRKCPGQAPERGMAASNGSFASLQGGHNPYCSSGKAGSAQQQPS